MKILKKVFLLAIGFLFAIQPAFAVMRAPFPNSKPLQPIPAGVLPNISRNVNSDITPVPPEETQAPVVAETNEQPIPSTEAPKGSSWYIYLSIIAGLSLVFYIRYLLEKSKQK